MSVEAIDRYLADCVANVLRTGTLPAWHAEFEERYDELAARVSFHGVSLLLWEAAPSRPEWPATLRKAMRQEATAQIFWEESHRTAITGLLEALSEAGIAAAVTKGTAIAYSLYPRPALRRRGDTDILVFDAERERTREVLRQCGFEPFGDRLSLQEMWRKEGREGFDHLVDLHWRVNASAAISRHLEQGGIAERLVPLPALCARAMTIEPPANLVLVCINRRLHAAHGYITRDEKLPDGDRLIWAVDIHFICEAMIASDWARLMDLVRRTGSAGPVRSGLGFAHRTLGVEVQEGVSESLRLDPGAAALNRHLETDSSWERLRLDLAGSANLRETLAHLKGEIAPGPDKLAE
ncbi:MAG: nucleotidyltransferase family protein, partial [Erythrobacter sp.]|nr:nucleotidyltransferase family protein [Erythrobacter sp.]